MAYDAIRVLLTGSIFCNAAGLWRILHNTLRLLSHARSSPPPAAGVIVKPSRTAMPSAVLLGKKPLGFAKYRLVTSHAIPVAARLLRSMMAPPVVVVSH